MAHRVAGFVLHQSTDSIVQGANDFDGTNAVSSNLFSQAFYVERVGTLCIQVSCPATGTPNGSFAIQGSNDQSKEEVINKPDTYLVNWCPLSFLDEATGATVQSKAVAGAQSFLATIAVTGPRWVRFSWTNTSGTANLTVRAQVKAVT
jgi:hypothetical protein